MSFPFSGIIVACGVGLLHTIYAKRNLKADLMPVDIAINLMCVLASKVAAQTYTTTLTQAIPIYNCTSGSIVPFQWKQLEDHYECLLRNPFENMLWYPYRTPMKENYYQDRACRILFHWIPAYCIDTVVYLARLKPIQLVKITSKMTKAIEALEYFSTREWTWKTDNVSLLYDELTYGDQSLYNFSFRNFDDWNSFFENYGLGAREFVMKSNPNTLHACRKKLKKFYIANQLMNILFVIIFYFLLSWLWKYSFQ
jgi:fatty acyl-CoA reductase